MGQTFDGAGFGVKCRVASSAQGACGIDIALRDHVIETVVLDRRRAFLAGELDLLNHTLATDLGLGDREHLVGREIGPLEIRRHHRNARHDAVGDEGDIGVCEIDGNRGENRIDDKGSGGAHGSALLRIR